MYCMYMYIKPSLMSTGLIELSISGGSGFHFFSKCSLCIWFSKWLFVHGMSVPSPTLIIITHHRSDVVGTMESLGFYINSVDYNDLVIPDCFEINQLIWWCDINMPYIMSIQTILSKNCRTFFQFHLYLPMWLGYKCLNSVHFDKHFEDIRCLLGMKVQFS